MRKTLPSVSPAEFVVTDCPVHGCKVTTDATSAQFYIDLANECATAPPHADEHRALNEDCWVCCPNMTIDPNGAFDAVPFVAIVAWDEESIAIFTRN